MSTVLPPHVPNSGLLVPVILPEMTVIGPTDMRLREHEHPEVQITMNFVAPRIAGKRKAVKDYPSHFSLYPSGMPHGGKEGDGSELLVTVFGPTDIEMAAYELLRRSSSEIVGAPCAVDPVVLSMGTVLRRELLQGRIRDPLLVEAVGVVLIGHIVRHWSSNASLRAVKGQLSPSQIRNTLEVIDNSLCTGIRVRDLANQAGVGTHQFTRLFRETMGCSPYRFVMMRRIEKARLLLEKTTIPLVDIALELGFVSQSHFTSAFHREMLTTPAAYRSAFRYSNRRRLSS